MTIFADDFNNMIVVAEMNRINWIDWAKVIAIAFVVFGHTPQALDSIPQRYICTFHMPLFFMLSGYLAKASTDTRKNIKKHWHSLILPYLLYNLLYYPYWIARYLLEGGHFSFVEMVMKPVLGVVFLQTDSSVSVTVSGVTWFLAALLIMRMALNLIYRSRHRMWLMIVSAVLVGILHGILQSNHMFHSLIAAGLLRCWPFYVIGHLLRGYALLDRVKDLYGSLGFLTASFVLFLFTDSATGLFFIGLTGSLGVIYFCRLLNRYNTSMLVTLSSGTIVIMGMHWMMIGTINYVVGKLSGQADVIYAWPVAALLTIAIMLTIYPFILFCRKRLPRLMGK